jgi:hypothetical protein
VLFIALAGLLGFGHYYWKYSRLVDAKLAGGPFNQASRILGEETTPDEIVSLLRNAGYSDSRHNPIGHYLVKPNAVEVYPGSLSYFIQEPAVIYYNNGRVVRIVSLAPNRLRARAGTDHQPV